MRTTLIIQDDLLAEAKKRAADRKSNVSAIVNEALRAALKADSGPARAGTFQMPTYRPAGAAARDTLPDELDSLIAAEDMGAYNG